MSQTTVASPARSARKTHVLAMNVVVENRYGMVSVASVTHIPFIVVIPNMTSSLAQLNNPAVNNKPGRLHFGRRSYQGPQKGANKSAAVENVSQIVSGDSGAEAYLCNSSCWAVITSATEAASCVIWKTWAAATKGEINVAIKSTEMVSLRRDEALSVQMMRTAQINRSQALTVPGP